MAKEKKVKAVRVKKVKVLHLTRYAVTAKAAPKLEDKATDTVGGIIYRVLAAAKNPLTTAELLNEFTEGQAKRMVGTMRSTLWALAKQGFVKITKHEEERKAA